MCTALLGLHAFTHCNSTSAFKGKGKVWQIKLHEKTEKYQKILGALGDHWDVSETLEKNLRHSHVQCMAEKMTPMSTIWDTQSREKNVVAEMGRLTSTETLISAYCLPARSPLFNTYTEQTTRSPFGRDLTLQFRIHQSQEKVMDGNSKMGLSSQIGFKVL